MPRHAGFAAAIAIREQTLRDLIRVRHHANQLPHTLGGAVPGISASFFLEQPLLTCSAYAGNRLILDLTGRGPLTIAPLGEPAATRTVLFRARMFVPPELSLLNGSLTFAVDGLSSVLDSFDIDPLAGGPYPPNAQAIIDSDYFRSGLETLLRTQLDAIGQLASPLSLAFLGGLANALGTTTTPALLDGVLALGIDVGGTNGVTTHGNPALLTDITAGNDIGMWTNPAALPIVMADAQTHIEEAVTDAGATLANPPAFTLIEGAFHISGHADKGNEGSVNFSLDAVPRLIRPGTHEEWDEEYGEHFEITTPAREELWFESANVEVDINRPWWSYVLSSLGVVFTFGIGTLVIEAIVDMIRNNIESGITQGGGETVAARVQEFTLAGTTEPTFRLKIETYECHVEGVFAGMTLRPQILAPRVEGPRFVPIEEALTASLRYVVKLPFDAHPQDPMLSVRWTVRRTDTNEIIRNIDTQALAGGTLDLSGEPTLLTAPELRIACRVYSTLGPITTDVFNDTVALGVTDTLDRSRPFVRWRHQVYTPVVRVEADGSHTELGYELKNRVSNIHRTAFPGRCRMASRYSAKVSRIDDGSLRPHLEYMDALPFPLEELVARRAAVCDYCFFGGPDKTAPII
jgi:hypothetical protein